MRIYMPHSSENKAYVINACWTLFIVYLSFFLSFTEETFVLFTYGFKKYSSNQDVFSLVLFAKI